MILFEKTKNKRKRGRGWPVKKNNLSTSSYMPHKDLHLTGPDVIGKQFLEYCSYAKLK